MRGWRRFTPRQINMRIPCEVLKPLIHEAGAAASRQKSHRPGPPMPSVRSQESESRSRSRVRVGVLVTSRGVKRLTNGGKPEGRGGGMRRLRASLADSVGLVSGQVQGTPRAPAVPPESPEEAAAPHHGGVRLIGPAGEGLLLPPSRWPWTRQRAAGASVGEVLQTPRSDSSAHSSPPSGV